MNGESVMIAYNKTKVDLISLHVFSFFDTPYKINLAVNQKS